MQDGKLTAKTKIQYVDSLAKSKFASAIVGKRLEAADQKGMIGEVIKMLDLEQVLEREIG